MITVKVVCFRFRHARVTCDYLLILNLLDSLKWCSFLLLCPAVSPWSWILTSTSSSASSLTKCDDVKRWIANWVNENLFFPFIFKWQFSLYLKQNSLLLVAKGIVRLELMSLHYLVSLPYRVCGKRDQKGWHLHGGHRRESWGPLPQGHDRHGGDPSHLHIFITLLICCVHILTLAQPAPTGHVWEAGERAEGNQHQSGGAEEELPGADGAQAHSAPHTAVFWWGQHQSECSACKIACVFFFI